MAEELDFNDEYNHSYSEEKNYIKPSEKTLLDQLEWFRDQKFGLMMHWGPYSQWGCCESWPLSDADSAWSREKDILWTSDSEFKKAYWSLNKTFNPVRFDPRKWAEDAYESGFKYLLFTTIQGGSKGFRRKL
jgi:alpha-L-fucosidase